MKELGIFLMCTSLAACGGSTSSSSSFEPIEQVESTTVAPVNIAAIDADDVTMPLIATDLTSVDIDITNDFGSLINGVRLSEGSEILTFDDRLGSAAQDYAQLMLDENHFSHVGPDGSTFTERVDAVGYEYTSLRENIASGHRDTDAVFTAWQNSEGHRNNNLADDVDDFGLGFAEDGSGTRWVLILGSEG
jgi:uncharacterized protein YkwD